MLENKLKHQKLSSDCPNKLAKLTMQGAAKVSLCDATKEVLSLADVKVMSKVQCCDVYTGKQHVLHSICSSRGNTQITYRKVASTSPSRLKAQAGFFILSIKGKGKFDVY